MIRRIWYVFAVFVLAGVLLGSPPKTIAYQGKLTDFSGVAIDTACDITFQLYRSSSGGTPIWSETHLDVPVHKGLFDVILGSVVPFPDSVDFSEQYYLQLVVGGEILSPRIPLSAAPYAINSGISQRSVYSDSAGWAGSVQWDSITGMPSGFADGVDDVGTVSWDTLGAYWDTTNHFASLDTLGAYADTTHNHSLSTLEDVDTSGISDGDVLIWSSSDGTWRVGTVSVTDNYADGLSFDDGTNTLTITRTGGLSPLTATINNEADDLSDNSIGDLGDVNVLSPADGQALVYDAVSGKWIPGTVSSGAISWDTLGAYWDTTNHFADLDTLGAYWDTTNNFVNMIKVYGDTALTDTIVLRAGSGITFARARDTLTISTTAAGGSQVSVLQPQYPSVVFTNLTGALNDSVWIRTYFDEATGNSFYQLSGAYGHDDQQYHIVALWQLPSNATTLDSVRIYYQTNTDVVADNGVSLEIRSGSSVLASTGGLLSSSTLVSWLVSSGLSSVAPGDVVQFVALLKADSDKWARLGKIKIYYH